MFMHHTRLTRMHAILNDPSIVARTRMVTTAFSFQGRVYALAPPASRPTPTSTCCQVTPSSSTPLTATFARTGARRRLQFLKRKDNAFDSFVSGSSSPWDVSATLAGASIVQSSITCGIHLPHVRYNVRFTLWAFDWQQPYRVTAVCHLSADGTRSHMLTSPRHHSFRGASGRIVLHVMRGKYRPVLLFSC